MRTMKDFERMSAQLTESARMQRNHTFVRLHMSVLSLDQITDIIQTIHDVCRELGYAKCDREALMALESEQRYRKAGGEQLKRARLPQ